MGNKTLVIIPAYNEEKHLPKLLPSISKKYDTLVIDDGSVDKTYEIARKFTSRVLHHKVNQGVGASLRDGFHYAIERGYENCIVVNADLQHPADLIDEFIEELENGFDAVVGSRLLGKTDSMPSIRRLGNTSFAFLVNLLYGTNYTDVTCGMRAFKTKVLKGVMSMENRYGIEIDMSIKMKKKRLKVVEKRIPAIYAPGTSKMRISTVWLQLLKPVIKNLF
ncbi:glycosyltransferase family 2 protein [Candidatus Micrarchaeota archaeon]|nr:glycosyltransferase family 2 protein [Candidatus Micrarchaeota archaeon]